MPTIDSHIEFIGNLDEINKAAGNNREQDSNPQVSSRDKP